MKLNENTKITLTVHQLKNLVKECGRPRMLREWDNWEGYWNARDADWESWASDRYTPGPKGKREFLDDNFSPIDLDKTISTVFSKSPDLKYKLDISVEDGDPYWAHCMVTASDGFKFVVDADGIGIPKFKPDGDWKWDHSISDDEVAKYFADGEDDIKTLKKMLEDYEADADQGWWDAPKTSDEYHYEEDDGDYDEDPDY